MTKRLVLINGMSVFYRGYFAMPGLSLPDGMSPGGKLVEFVEATNHPHFLVTQAHPLFVSYLPQ